MLTIFSTAKPFCGGDLTRQRNALRSWTLLHPDCEVILFGDVPGAREVAAELGIHHVPDVLRSEYGSVRLDDMFARAQESARHSTETLLCARTNALGPRWMSEPIDDVCGFTEGMLAKLVEDGR